MAKLSMTRAEREAFLADVHIGLLAINGGEGAPLVTPVWYRYSPGGDVQFVILKDGEKGRALSEGKMVSLCAQTEQSPYKYVTVEGPVTLGTIDYERDILGIAERYLGKEGARAYASGNTPESAVAGSYLVSFAPAKWRTVDYSKL